MADEVTTEAPSESAPTIEATPETPAVETPETPEVEATPEAETEEAPEQERVEPETEKESDDDFTPMYNGQEVTITISDELTAAAEGYGITPDQLQSLSNDLYSGEDFNLSDESRELLRTAGVSDFMINQYLSGLKLQNDKMFSDHEASIKGQAEARDKAWAETQEIIGGGEEAWDAMSDWANENLTDAEMSDWEAIMKSDNWYMQKLAIKDLHARSKSGSASDSLHPAQADGSMTGSSVELFEANGGSTSNSTSAISGEQFRELMKDPKYFSDPEFQKSVDARRKLGQAKGL